MSTFEYLVVILQATSSAAHLPMIKDAPTYAVAYLKPQLDELGTQGWELVSLEPVVVGNSQDLMPIAGAPSSKYWTHDYLCSFKRPRPA